MAIIGIDLGTTNSLVSVYRNGHAELLPNEWGEFMTPSCVGVLEDGTVTVGAVAKERLITHPEETAASFKTWLRKLAQSAREALGEEIEEAIISVPAYFNDNQRCATRLAAQLAGLPVKRLINEPSAAALYYSQSRAQSECRLLVIDFGGGFGIPYHKYEDQPRLDMDDLGSRLHGLISGWAKKTGYTGRFLVEPGRYVVAECGVLLGHQDQR